MWLIKFIRSVCTIDVSRAHLIAKLFSLLLEIEAKVSKLK